MAKKTSSRKIQTRKTESDSNIRKSRTDQAYSSVDQEHNAHSNVDSPIITLSEAGRQIGKSSSTMSRWVQDGLIPSVRHPTGLPGIRQSDLDALYGVAKKLHKNQQTAVAF